jgi:IS30 family transposase
MQRYRRVTYEDRCQIEAFLGTKMRIKEISEKLGLHRSTIYREINRNKGTDYKASAAIIRSKARRRSCRRKMLLSNVDLRETVFLLLQKGWSPEQISGRLKYEGKPLVSRQTIYSYLRRHSYKDCVYLRRDTSKKKGRSRLRRGKNYPSWMRSIHSRPAEVKDRSVMGHWERDGMFVRELRQLVVFLERKSRYVRIEKVKHPYNKHITKQMQKMIEKMPNKVLSLTNDHGNEFLDAKNLPVPVYYCDPRSPHQKGSVENAIGLLRQYLPRSTDLNKVSNQKVRDCENALNHRPRKCLGFKTPHEVYFMQNVALAT